MLSYHRLTQLSTTDLKRRMNFHRIALYVVWFGGSFAIGAALYQLINKDLMAYETFKAAALALMASYPVYIRKTKIAAVLKTR